VILCNDGDFAVKFFKAKLLVGEMIGIHSKIIILSGVALPRF
jgi:hypothetical protein